MILVILGVLLILGEPVALLTTVRMPVVRHPLAQAYVYGLLFGPVALPCAGPFIVALLAISIGVEETAGRRPSTFVAFGLGMGAPLIGWIRWARRDPCSVADDLCDAPPPGHRPRGGRDAHRGRARGAGPQPLAGDRVCRLREGDDGRRPAGQKTRIRSASSVQAVKAGRGRLGSQQQILGDQAIEVHLRFRPPRPLRLRSRGG